MRGLPAAGQGANTTRATGARRAKACGRADGAPMLVGRNTSRKDPTHPNHQLRRSPTAALSPSVWSRKGAGGDPMQRRKHVRKAMLPSSCGGAGVSFTALPGALAETWARDASCPLESAKPVGTRKQSTLLSQRWPQGGPCRQAGPERLRRCMMRTCLCSPHHTILP